MRTRVLLLVVVLLTPSASHAQGCAADTGRPSIGGGAGATGMDAYLSRSTTRAPLTQDVLALGGFSAALHADVAVAPGWGIRAQLGASAPRVQRQTLGPHYSGVVLVEHIGRMSERDLIAGVVRHSQRRRPVCGYWAAMGGVYRYAYNGDAVRAPGIALVAGIEGPAAETRPYGEVRLGFASTHGRPPLNSYLTTSLGIAVGIRRRW
jgi:hypothetical protein